MAAGGLTLMVAAAYKKGWSWWIVGVLVIVPAFLFLHFLHNDGDVPE
jgi:hypothetical protein